MGSFKPRLERLGSHSEGGVISTYDTRMAILLASIHDIVHFVIIWMKLLNVWLLASKVKVW